MSIHKSLVINMFILFVVALLLVSAQVEDQALALFRLCCIPHLSRDKRTAQRNTDSLYFFLQ